MKTRPIFVKDKAEQRIQPHPSPSLSIKSPISAMNPLYLFTLSLLCFFAISSSSLLTPITLPLHALPHPPHPDPLVAAVAASLRRAAHIKKTPSSSLNTTIPLSPHSYGGYSISLLFGTPPQPIPLILDTGSSLTWLPCTSSYHCSRCGSFPTPVFLPKSSSSSRIVGCRNPKCSWIHPPSVLSSCAADASGTPKICPIYLLMYGSGSTAGLLLSETLTLSPALKVPNFAAGCSVYADRQPAGGIAGLGRGPISLPSQLRLSRFSYCLISRRFDDNPIESGSLVLDPVLNSSDLEFTPLLKNPNPNPNSVSDEYYYIGLRRISVGGVKVKIPHRPLVASPGGDGGSIVDSGTTFTYMAPAVFEPVAAAFVERVAGRYNRSAEVEGRTGLRLCFEMPAAGGAAELPEMTLHFKGGAEMRLPLENYFAFAGAGKAAACLTVVSDGGGGGGGGGGPAVILGSFQQQNYYVVYDLERERIGFRQEKCVIT